MPRSLSGHETLSGCGVGFTTRLLEILTSRAHLGFWTMMRLAVQLDHEPNSQLFPLQSMRTIHFG